VGRLARPHHKIIFSLSAPVASCRQRRLAIAAIDAHCQATWSTSAATGAQKMQPRILFNQAGIARKAQQEPLQLLTTLTL
jgi:hypothetical protein